MGTYSGKYNRVITIQTPIRTKQANGEMKITSWDNVVVDLPAFLKQSSENSMKTSGVENFESGQRVASTTIQFLVRYPRSFAITEVMQVVFEGNAYKIINATETGIDKRTEMTIVCQVKDNS